MTAMLASMVGPGTFESIVAGVGAADSTRPGDSENSFNDSSKFSCRCDYDAMVEELGSYSRAGP